MRAIWKEIPRDPKKGKWVGLYASLNPRGAITISRLTWEKTGGPTAYQVFFDAANQRIGLKPTAKGIRGSYPVGTRGKHGGRRIHAHPVVVECRLILKHTLEFPFAEVDTDGILILDLRTAVINKTSLARQRNRQPAKPNLEAVTGEPTDSGSR